MTPGSRHTTAKSTQHLLLARRVNFLVPLIRSDDPAWNFCLLSCRSCTLVSRSNNSFLGDELILNQYHQFHLCSTSSFLQDVGSQNMIHCDHAHMWYKVPYITVCSYVVQSSIYYCPLICDTKFYLLLFAHMWYKVAYITVCTYAVQSSIYYCLPICGTKFHILLSAHMWYKVLLITVGSYVIQSCIYYCLHICGTKFHILLSAHMWYKVPYITVCSYVVQSSIHYCPLICDTKFY